MAREPFKWRDENGALRLDELLGEEAVRHYTTLLSGGSNDFREQQLRMAVATPRPDREEAFYSWEEPPRGPLLDGYILSSEGPYEREASSCTEIALAAEICWDVCRYYRDLGVHWKATRREILAAAMERDPGRDDPRLAYIVTQLLDPVIRRAYDRCGLGELFIGDRDVQAMIEAQAAREASRRNAEAWMAGEEYDPGAQQRRVLGEWGIDSGLSDAAARARLREDYAAETEPLGDPGEALGATLSAWERLWGWYRLTGPHDPYDPQRWPQPRALEAWQAMIARALSEAGATISFAVGIWPGHAPKDSRIGNKACIFFIGNGYFSQADADEAVSRALGPG
jgi:hypothetical protein